MCLPWKHHWEKWEQFEVGKVLRTPSDSMKILGHEPAVIGVYEYQRRVCLLCGKSQLREVAA